MSDKDWEVRLQGGHDFLNLISDNSGKLEIKGFKDLIDLVSVIAERLTEKNKTLQKLYI